ncbi:WHG domain-containing protein (plasmid) [Streptomyces sp. NBC_01369]
MGDPHRRRPETARPVRPCRCGRYSPDPATQRTACIQGPIWTSCRIYGLGYLPPPVTALLLIAWGHLHGLVALEVFRHTSFLGDHHTETFRTAIRNLLEDIHRRIAVAPAPRP